MLKQSILAGEHTQQRQVGVVAHTEDIGAWTLGLRQMFPGLRIPAGQLAVLDGSTCRAAVAQQYEIGTGDSRRRTLLQSGLECLLQIGAAAELAQADKFQRALHV